MDYDYYFSDNQFYRVRANRGFQCIEDVWTPNGWRPYTGDRGKPYAFGSRIKAEQVPPFRSRVIDLTEQGGAFQILAAPPKSQGNR